MTGGIKGRKEITKKGGEEAIHFFGSRLAITPLVPSALRYEVAQQNFGLEMRLICKMTHRLKKC